MILKMVDIVSITVSGIIIQTLATKSSAGLFNGAYFDVPENNESSMVHDVIHLISRLKWSSPVIFTDNLRVTLFQKLQAKLTHEERTSSSCPLVFNVSSMTKNDLEINIPRIQQLYKKKIPLLLLCSMKNIERILSTGGVQRKGQPGVESTAQVNDSTALSALMHVLHDHLAVLFCALLPRNKKASTIDERTNGFLDFKHRSFWLVVAGMPWTEDVRNASSLMENMAVLPYRTDSSYRHRSDALFKNYYSTDCTVVCEEQYISTALGTAQSRHWKWLSYDDVHRSMGRDDLELVLFPNTGYGYNGRELRVATIPDPPYVERTTEANRTVYSGFCFEVFDDIVKSLNLSYRVLPYADLKFGDVHKESGNWSGIVGELQQRNVDVAVTSLWIDGQRSKAIDYVEPGIGTVKIVFLYRRTSLDTDLSLLSFLDPFKTNVYLVIIGIFLTVPLFFYIIEIHLNDKNNKIQLQDVYFHFMGILFQQGGSLCPVSWSARAVISTFWLCSICLAASYSAYLTASLTTSHEIQPFTNIKELLQRDDYKIGIHAANKEILRSAKKGILKEVWQRILESNRTDSTIFDKDRGRQTKKILTERFVLVTGERNAREMVLNTCDLSILPEALHAERVAFAVTKGSPYLSDLEHKMRHLMDSGTIGRMEEGPRERQTKCERIKQGTVSMNYMLGKLSLLVLGSAIATLTLTTELVARRMVLRVNIVKKTRMGSSNPISKMKR